MEKPDCKSKVRIFGPTMGLTTGFDP